VLSLVSLRLVTAREETALMPTQEEEPRSDRNHWYWLLILPVVVPLLPMLYNAKDPTLWGIPRFYWLQLAFVVLGVVTTVLVYQRTKR
jgi:hypothetical protein